MRLNSQTFNDYGFMPDECAFGLLGPGKQYRDGPNRNPHLAWSDLPKGTRSLVLINDDLDVPVNLDTFNKEGMTVSYEQQRRILCHWVLIDLDPDSGPIRLGEFSDGVTIGGKAGPAAPRGARQGINGYTAWLRDHPTMKGNYFGYDGPCPPWNDEIPHRYVFKLFALDVPHLAVEGMFEKSAVVEPMRGHVLGHATVTGLFKFNLQED